MFGGIDQITHKQFIYLQACLHTSKAYLSSKEGKVPGRGRQPFGRMSKTSAKKIWEGIFYPKAQILKLSSILEQY